MNRRRILGAIRFPAFMLVWTAGVVVVTLELEAAGEESLPFTAAPVELPAPPALDDAGAWSTALAQLDRHSEVLNGSWQPAAPRAVPPIHPVASIAAPHAASEEPAAQAVALAAAVDKPVATAPPVPAVRSMTVARVVKEPALGFTRFGTDKTRAREALRGGRFGEAYALLRPRVGEARHDSEYLGLLALAAMRLGSHGEAMVLYQRLAGIEPDSGRWRMGLALAQQSLGLDATAEYQQALALAEDPADIRALLSAHVDDGGVT